MHFAGSSISMESDEALKYVSRFQHTWRPWWHSPSLQTDLKSKQFRFDWLEIFDKFAILNVPHGEL
jgi:hypothetical protein